MSPSDSVVTYTSISSEDVQFWGICFFGMEHPDSPEAALQSPIQTPLVPQDDDECEPMFIQPHDPCQSLCTLKSDLEEDLEEYEHDESEDGSLDYPMNGGDDGDKMTGTKPVIPPPSTDITTTRARITVWLQASISIPPEAEVERLLAMPTPPLSPLTLLSPPSARECLARISSTQALIDAVTTALPSPSLPPLPPLPPPLYIPPPVDRKDDIPETELPPHKKSCLFALGLNTLDAEASQRGIREVGYGIRDTWVDRAEVDPEIAPITLGEVNTKACAHSVVLSQAVHYELQTHREQVYAHESQIKASGTDGRDSLSDWRHETRDGQIMAHVTRRGQNTPPNNINPNNMTPESIQAMIDQALLRNSINGDGSHSSDGDNQRNVQTVRLCFYADFMKCQPLNFKGTEGIASKPKTLDETIELANDLMDQKLHTYVKRQTDNKKKADDSSRNNHGHQQHPSKRQNVAKKCHKFNKVGHLAHNCRSSGNTNVANTQRDNREIPKGNVGNAKKKWNASRDPDSNVVIGTFLLNNRYASILFDTGADRSFMSITFSSLIDIIPTPLGNSYDVELADGKIVRAQEYMAKGCQMFLAHISAKKEEDKSEGKQFKDVPIIQDFPEVFPEDFPGLPPARLVEF
uniref:Reverse transcriptase domain-containing protein n=1 Tax=Tanacetum cinerariifolium TaxID=118510 RepID=A0A699H126_TANCI|nr:hypothetical protein [Tanacetum cinerariifolium]